MVNFKNIYFDLGMKYDQYDYIFLCEIHKEYRCYKQNLSPLLLGEDEEDKKNHHSNHSKNQHQHLREC